MGIVEIINSVNSIVNSMFSIYIWNQKKNANQQINEANKIMAGYHAGRMLGKASNVNNKTNIAYKTNDAFNAYIVGTTSYNTSEATARAHEIQAARRKKNVVIALVAQASLNVIMCVVYASYWRLIALLVILVYIIMMEVKEGETITHLINMVTSYGIIRMSLEFAFILLSYYKVIPTTAVWLSSIGYGAIASMIAVLRLI